MGDVARLWSVPVERPGLFGQSGEVELAATSVAILGALDQAIPIMVRELRRLTPDQRIARARRAWGEVTGHGDGRMLSGGADLMFGGRHQEAEFNALVTVLAALAYQPGGVTFATRHWCTDHRACLHAAWQASRA